MLPASLYTSKTSYAQPQALSSATRLAVAAGAEAVDAAAAAGLGPLGSSKITYAALPLALCQYQCACCLQRSVGGSVNVARAVQLHCSGSTEAVAILFESGVGTGAVQRKSCHLGWISIFVTLKYNSGLVLFLGT